jgi:nucleoside-diphosphate-sugar epimerase
MRVFVTGCTGYLGSAIAAEFIRGGHDVTGLVRSPAQALELRKRGIAAVEGDLRNCAMFATRAAEHEAVVHAGLDASPDGGAFDRACVTALLTALRRAPAPRVFVYTSGVWALGDVPASADEGAVPRPPPDLAFRVVVEREALDAETPAVAVAVVRPGILYGGTGGLISSLFASATSEGAAPFVGDGENRWTLVHRDDAAALYRTIVEDRARGIFHAVDGSPTRARDAARAASEAAGAGGRTRSLSNGEARARWGAAVDGLLLDQVVVAGRSGTYRWAPLWKPFTESAADAYAEWKRMA